MKIGAQRQRLPIFVGTTFVVLAAVVFLVLIPQQNAMHSASDRIYQERLNAEIATLQRQNAAVSKVEYDRLQSNGKELDSFFVHEDSILEFISALEGVAQSAGVHQEIQNLRAPEGNALSSDIALVVSGPFKSIVAYIDLLQQIPYYVAVSQIVTSADTQSGGTGVTATLNAKIFWL